VESIRRAASIHSIFPFESLNTTRQKSKLSPQNTVIGDEGGERNHSLARLESPESWRARLKRAGRRRAANGC
jgi:hypothetical protein